MTCDLRLGRYQDTLAGVTCDTLIVDAPYSARTHGGHDSLKSKHGHRRAIDYTGWTPEDVCDFATFFAPRVRGWWVSITDHVLAPVWADAMAAQGLYVFAPLPWVAHGSRVRLAGDGPSSWTCWIIVARPRCLPFSRWGTLRGAYLVGARNHGTHRHNATQPVVGAKPLALMRALVRDYSRPGDVICDPCAGGGTTLRAAQLEGRNGIGSEMDPETHAKAAERLAQPFTPPLLVDAPAPEQMTIGDQ